MGQITSQVEVNSERQVRRDKADNSQYKVNRAEHLGISLRKAAVATCRKASPGCQTTCDEMQSHFSRFGDREESGDADSQNAQHTQEQQNHTCHLTICFNVHRYLLGIDRWKN